MQNNLYFGHYSHHFVILAYPGPYPANLNGTKVPHCMELQETQKDAKKAYDIAIAMHIILQNQLNNAIPDDYLAELWDTDEFKQNSSWRKFTHCLFLFSSHEFFVIKWCDIHYNVRNKFVPFYS